MKQFTILFALSFIQAESLLDVYNASGPANGYNKYVILESGNTYTGGIGIFEGSVYIEGNGATVDLEQGTGIWIYSDGITDASLDADKISIVNGNYYGLSYAGYSTGMISNCNFVGNNDGIELMENCSVEVKNCNFISNARFAVAQITSDPTLSLFYCNSWGNGDGDYMLNALG